MNDFLKTTVIILGTAVIVASVPSLRDGISHAVADIFHHTDDDPA